MEKKTILELTDISLDCLGIVCPPAAAAKRILIGARDIIFREEINKLDQEKFIRMLENEKFLHLLLQVQDACKRSKEEEKARFFCKFFRTIVEKEEFTKQDSDEIEEFIYLFSTLSFREILALHKIREFTKINEKNRISVNNIIIEDFKSWDEVTTYFGKKLEISIKIKDNFLLKLESSGLIVKNLNEKNSICYSQKEKRWLKTSELETIKINSYISTPYFEKLYLLSEDIENYLNKCGKDYF